MNEKDIIEHTEKMISEIFGNNTLEKAKQLPNEWEMQPYLDIQIRGCQIGYANVCFWCGRLMLGDEPSQDLHMKEYHNLEV